MLLSSVDTEIVRRQSHPHTWLLLDSAVAWLIGNVMFAFGSAAGSGMPWWFAFLIWTSCCSDCAGQLRAPGAQVAGTSLLLVSIIGSAVLWSAGFALYAICYWTVLTRPRLDGKPG